MYLGVRARGLTRFLKNFNEEGCCLISNIYVLFGEAVDGVPKHIKIFQDVLFSTDMRQKDPEQLDNVYFDIRLNHIQRF